MQTGRIDSSHTVAVNVAHEAGQVLGDVGPEGHDRLAGLRVILLSPVGGDLQLPAGRRSSRQP